MAFLFFAPLCAQIFCEKALMQRAREQHWFQFSVKRDGERRRMEKGSLLLLLLLSSLLAPKERRKRESFALQPAPPMAQVAAAQNIDNSSETDLVVAERECPDN